jgi:hypothetical protein
MNFGGIFLLFLVIVGAGFGLFVVVSKANLSAPVDSAGVTTGLSDNATRTVVQTSAVPVVTLTGWIMMIGAAMVLGLVLIYLAVAAKGSNFRSRY